MFTKRRLLVISSLVAVYLSLATWTEFYPAGPPTGTRTAIGRRFSEVLLVWTGWWALTGWRVYRTGDWKRSRLGDLLILMVPLGLGVGWSGTQLATVWSVLFERPAGAPPLSTSWWLPVGGMFALLGPLAYGVGCSWLLRTEMSYIRRLLTGRYCAKCGYDLTGNVSGICPECGIPIAKPTSYEGKLNGKNVH